MSLFLAPPAAILVGAAIPVLYRRALRLACERPGRTPLRIGYAGAGMGLAVYGFVPLVCSLYHVAAPWPRFDGREAANYILARRQADERIVIALEQGLSSTDLAYFCRGSDGTVQCRLDELPAAPPARYWLTFKLPWGEQSFERFIEQAQWRIHERRVIGQILIVLVQSRA